MSFSKLVNSFCFCFNKEENQKILNIDINNNDLPLQTNPQTESNDKEKNSKECNILCLATTVNNEGNEKEKFHSMFTRNYDKGLKVNPSTFSNFKLICTSKNENKNEDPIKDLKRNHTITNQNSKNKISGIKNQSTIKKKVTINEPIKNNEKSESNQKSKKEETQKEEHKKEKKEENQNKKKKEETQKEEKKNKKKKKKDSTE